MFKIIFFFTIDEISIIFFLVQSCPNHNQVHSELNLLFYKTNYRFSMTMLLYFLEYINLIS